MTTADAAEQPFLRRGSHTRTHGDDAREFCRLTLSQAWEPHRNHEATEYYITFLFTVHTHYSNGSQRGSAREMQPNWWTLNTRLPYFRPIVGLPHSPVRNSVHGKSYKQVNSTARAWAAGPNLFYSRLFPHPDKSARDFFCDDFGTF